MKHMKRFSFFIVFGILIYCYLGISMNYQEKFKVLEDKLDNKTAVLLDNSMDPLVLAQIMVNNSYVPTQPDADFIAQFLKGILQTEEPPQAIMELAKRDWQIPAGDISPSTPSLMKRLEETRHQTGWNEYMDTLYCQQLPSVTEVGEGDGADMTVKVKNPVPMKGLPKWKQQWLKAMKRTDTPAEGVLVRLCRVSKGEGTHSLATPIAYAMTDTEGSVTFKGLAPDSSYSVLPIQKDMTFGAEKGTRLGNWGAQMEKEETVYEFLSYPLKLRVLTSQNLVAMRDGGLVVVRTPENFKKQLTNRFICFMGVWLLLFIIGNVGKLRMDNLLAAVLMLISGLGMMLMFGFNDPMTQRVLGDEMSIGYIIGVIFMVAAMCMDFKRFFQNYYWVPFDFTMRCWDGVVWVARHIGLVWCFRKAGNGLYRLIKPVLNPAINPNPQTRGER